MAQNRKWLWVLWLLMITSKNLVESKKKYKTLHFTQVRVQFNPKYLENHTLVIGPDQTTLDVILNIRENFADDPWVEILIGTLDKKLNMQRTLFTYDVNVCNILGKESKGAQSQFLQLWLNNFLKYGNLPRSCPIMKGNYYWNCLKVEKFSVPVFLTLGKLRGHINTYFPHGDPRRRLRNSIANLSIDFELKYKYAK